MTRAHAPRQVAGKLERIEYADGEDIIVEGEPGDALYIVEEGAAKATKLSIPGVTLMEYGAGAPPSRLHS